MREVAAQGVGILLAEHVQELVMAVSDRIIVLHHGSKIAEGTPAKSGKIRRCWRPISAMADAWTASVLMLLHARGVSHDHVRDDPTNLFEFQCYLEMVMQLQRLVQANQQKVGASAAELQLLARIDCNLIQ